MNVSTSPDRANAAEDHSASEIGAASGSFAVDGSNSEWVDFELGEGIQHASQDAAWAKADIDGRGHVSHRELTLLHAPQFCLSIEDYRTVEMLMSEVYCGRRSFFRWIQPEALLTIIEYAMPGQGPLVSSARLRRDLSEAFHFAKFEQRSCLRGAVKLPSLLSPPSAPQESAKSKVAVSIPSVANSEEEEDRVGDAVPIFPFRICVRKRPLMPYELYGGAYDVCYIDQKERDEEGLNHSLTLHEGKLARNGRRLSMTHRQYYLDRVFSDEVSNEEVCKDAVQPLLNSVAGPEARPGQKASFLCFGQTGTGKTYTFHGALEYISQKLVNRTVRVTFFEVHGKKCYDLLSGSRRNLVHLRADGRGQMHARGARQCVLEKMSHRGVLLALLRDGLALRTSKVTERNPISSRSHAVCSIEILPQSQLDGDIAETGVEAGSTTAETSPASSSCEEEEESAEDTRSSVRGSTRSNPVSLTEYLKAQAIKNTSSSSPESGPKILAGHPTTGAGVGAAVKGSAAPSSQAFDWSRAGKIMLVDLAGSERNYETVKMTAAQHKESADINSALMALKNCFRAYQQLLSLNEAEATEAAATAAEGVVVAGSGLQSNSKLPSSSSSFSSAALSSSTFRIPYRDSLLTKILKDCFTSGANHRTTIVATIAPSPIDLQHSVNTLDHVVLMSPVLSKFPHTVTVEVPMATGAALSGKPIETWTSVEVNAWLAGAERGRFAQVMLPPGTDGKTLLQLTPTNFAELFAAEQLRVARREREGDAWVVSAVDDTFSSSSASASAAAATATTGATAAGTSTVVTASGGGDSKPNRIGKALWIALRRENQSAATKARLLAEASQARQQGGSSGNSSGMSSIAARSYINMTSSGSATAAVAGSVGSGSAGAGAI